MADLYLQTPTSKRKNYKCTYQKAVLLDNVRTIEQMIEAMQSSKYQIQCIL